MAMTPLSFDIETCKAVVRDEYTRVIEAKARADADKGIYEDRTPFDKINSFQGQWLRSMMMLIYAAQWTKRKARNERKSRVVSS